MKTHICHNVVNATFKLIEKILLNINSHKNDMGYMINLF